MADIIDSANDQIELLMDFKLKEAANKIPLKIGNKFCIDCDVVIPDARRLTVLGCERCIDCQSILEERTHT